METSQNHKRSPKFSKRKRVPSPPQPAFVPLVVRMNPRPRRRRRDNPTRLRRPGPPSPSHTGAQAWASTTTHYITTTSNSPADIDYPRQRSHSNRPLFSPFFLSPLPPFLPPSSSHQRSPRPKLASPRILFSYRTLRNTSSSSPTSLDKRDVGTVYRTERNERT